jgi:choline dehydrogenase-like flavoprotein
VVVGRGSAGCAVARRLAESGARVVLSLHRTYPVPNQDDPTQRIIPPTRAAPLIDPYSLSDPC